MHIDDFLKIVVEKGASDLHLKVGSPPTYRIDGALVSQDELDDSWKGKILQAEDTESLSKDVLDEVSYQEFVRTREFDIAYSVPKLGRFRVNLFFQCGSIGLVLRSIPFSVPGFKELHLPNVIQELSEKRSGLVLVTGQAGSGKSTTLAAMIDHINNTRRCHIVTIEDPIEFLHTDKKSIVNQREIGFDTISFSEALKHVVRQDPNVILIGEMRDLETIVSALSAAETGHLVFSTLHTINAPQTVERIINFFPPYQHDQVRMQFAGVLQGVISLRLLPRAGGRGRIPAVEVMIATALVKKLIEEGKISELKEAIQKGGFYGMQTFNQSLVSLVQKGLVSYEDALEAATNPEELKLNLSGIYTGSDGGAESTRW